MGRRTGDCTGRRYHAWPNGPGRYVAPGPTSLGSGGADPGTFLTGYFDTAPGSEAFGAGDNALRIENPTAANGDLCAMIYIFDASEELGCCGCV